MKIKKFFIGSKKSDLRVWSVLIVVALLAGVFSGWKFHTEPEQARVDYERLNKMLEIRGLDKVTCGESNERIISYIRSVGTEMGIFCAFGEYEVIMTYIETANGEFYLQLDYENDYGNDEPAGAILTIVGKPTDYCNSIAFRTDNQWDSRNGVFAALWIETMGRADAFFEKAEELDTALQAETDEARKALIQDELDTLWQSQRC